MGDNADRRVSLRVQQQNNHLAVALLRAMLSALAEVGVLAGRLQVERADGLYTTLPQALDEPFHSPAAGLCYLEEWRITVHAYTQ